MVQNNEVKNSMKYMQGGPGSLGWIFRRRVKEKIVEILYVNHRKELDTLGFTENLILLDTFLIVSVIFYCIGLSTDQITLFYWNILKHLDGSFFRPNTYINFFFMNA